MSIVPKSEVVDFSTYNYHPMSEEIVDILKLKTRSDDAGFFRINVAYFLAKLAATMRTNIKTHDRGKIPVNVYAINFAPSGAGKGYSKNILEENIVTPFKEVFMEDTYQIVAENSLRAEAKKRTLTAKDCVDAEYDKLEDELKECGPFVFSFDSATTAAVKQMRDKLLRAGSGSMSLEIDEFGSHITEARDVITTYLELYDVGKIGTKLIKNTADQKRMRPMEGKTPANLLLFGTPNKIYDDPKNSEEYRSMLDVGYGRRCIYNYSKVVMNRSELTGDEMYAEQTSTVVADRFAALATHITQLAKVDHFGQNLKLTRKTHVFLFNYQIDCEKRVKQVEPYQYKDMVQTELLHRHFKVLKLAGAYAFIDGSEEVTEEHIRNAIRLVEDSGESYAEMIEPEKPYERIARYIAEAGREVTQVDLIENLKFFKGSEPVRRNLVTLAIAYGIKNNVLIKKSYIDEIEIYTGEMLEETDITQLTLAYSNDLTKDYHPVHADLAEFDDLLLLDGMNFTAHHFADNYRESSKAIPGFNMIVLDVDENTSLSTAQTLLADYTYKMYTTKSHTDEVNRFRIILPMSHTLKLGAKEYSQFMQNVFDWLPFFCDTATKDIARKWATNKDAIVFNNVGQLITATDFIPQTKASETMRKRIDKHNLGNLENWFLRETKDGNRSHMFLRYGMTLKDAGFTIDVIRDRIDTFNKKIDEPLEDNEISTTIMMSIAKKMTEAAHA